MTDLKFLYTTHFVCLQNHVYSITRNHYIHVREVFFFFSEGLFEDWGVCMFHFFRENNLKIFVLKYSDALP